MCGVLCILLGSANGSARAFDCARKYCKRMSSCAEAHHKYSVCNYKSLDRDKDGIPCENLCGDSLTIYKKRLRAGEVLPSSVAAPSTQSILVGNSSSDAPDMSCAGKRRCGQMVSCKEARFYLSKCGLGSLDKDGDGTPCEGLCRDQ